MSILNRLKGEKEFLYGIACLATIAIGIAGYAFINHATNTQEYESLIERVQSLALTIDPEAIAQLSLSEADLENPAYQDLKELMTGISEVNEDVEFVYLMAKRGNDIYFIADSEDPVSEDYSPPGQRYDEASDALKGGWNPGTPYVLEIEADRWGYWISALAPVVDQEGTTVALLGMDKNANTHRVVFLTQVGLVVLATLLLLLLISVLYLLSKKEAELEKLREEFTAMIVHELRTPLSGIHKAAELLQQPTHKLESSLAQYVHIIYQNASGMLDLVNDILDTAKLQAGKFEITRDHADIRDAIDNRITFFHVTADERKIRLHSVIPDTVPADVLFDLQRIKQVLNNFLSNALKFTPEGGSVTVAAVLHESGARVMDEIKAAGTELAALLPEETFATLPRSLIVTVTDSGGGIKPELISQLFATFKQLDTRSLVPSVTGTGLGLAIAKGIIEEHGGVVGVVSTVGTGSTFYFTIPIIDHT